MSVPPGGELTLTALDEALVIKTAGAVTALSVKTGAKAAVSYYPVEPHKTLVIKNTDPDYPHAVRIENAQSGRNFKFDYAVENEGTTNFASEYSAGEMSVPPNAVLTLTAREDALIVRLPSSVGQISIANGTTPALIYAQIQAGVSFVAGNNGGEPVTMTAIKGDKVGFWDYLRRDTEHEILTFGRVGTEQPYTLEPGETTHFTNTENFAVKFIFPSSLLTQGLYVDFTDAPALYRRVLTFGEALAVTNKDKTYSKELTVAEEDNKPSDYDYAAVNTKGELQDFGLGRAGVVSVKNSQTLIIAPQSGSVLSVRYPYEMHETVFAAADAAAPLHRITLAPGEKVTFTNKSRVKTYVINNSSGTGSAAYFLRDKADTRPIGRNEEPVIGDINIPGNDTITITAAAGDDLKIWLPVEWVKDLLQ
jgi:plastocyanin